MTQTTPLNLNTLPGIVTDQPEIFESDPVPSDDTGVNDLNDLIGEPTNEAIALIEVPIKQAFSYFAERENEIAKFYVQRYGEYKIAGDRPDDETDLEKYHRLVSEVHELLGKFQTNEASKNELSAVTRLNNQALTNNLDVLARQLKELEFAAENESLDPTLSGFVDIKSKLEKLGQKVLNEPTGMIAETKEVASDDSAKVIRMGALERRINFLETLLGHNESKTQTLFETTKSESLSEAVETMSSWLSISKQENFGRLNRDLDYLTQRLEKLNEHTVASDSQLDSQTKSKIDQLCNMVTATDKYRAMVPTIIHRLTAMEELQRKAALVVTTVDHLEQIQSQISENVQANKKELKCLNEMFAKNMELIKEFSKSIDSRIASIREAKH